MPRITKELPGNRADYTFGDLVYWHLFKYGTRPNISPSAKAGRVWEAAGFSDLLGISDRTLRNWIFDKHLPDDIGSLSKELFGENKAWDEARLELQDRLEKGWARKNRKSGLKTTTAVDEVNRTDSPTTETPAVEGSAQGKEEPANPPEPEAPKSDAGNGQGDEPPKSRALDPVQPGPGKKPVPASFVRAALAALAVVLGIYAFQTSREDKGSTQQKATVETAPPKKQVTEQPQDRNQLVSVPIVQPPVAPRAEPPAISKQELPPVVRTELPAQPTPPRQPTEQEQREAEQRRIEGAAFAARQVAYDNEKRQREAEALRLDALAQDTGRQEQQRENDTRLAAGMGFRLRENIYVANAAFRSLLTESVLECALACIKENCDAFAFYRNQFGPNSRQPRYCYLHRKPFTTANGPGHTFGERVAGLPEPSAPAGAAIAQAPSQPVQAEKGAATAANSGGLIYCAGIPLKVTGFKITCDQITGGGSTLINVRVRYPVSNINECAAKCRPVPECKGFTYNSGDPDGQHACQIFGAGAAVRESQGWISGAR